MMNVMNSLTGGDGDLWYLWVAFDITFLVLAIEIAITVGSNRRQRRRGHVVHPRTRGSTLTEKP
ncbi:MULTISPECIES: heme exporter protein CcmD [unclassified Caballeronia]|uniref:heme exporter protein CcmD n=1 Tax=unclassified Caballeronia TaxID=2646786 RepID=UPI001F154EBB|nr:MULTISPECIES: heme exporter protein CcmD [unclassified Caballeronia]